MLPKPGIKPSLTVLLFSCATGCSLLPDLCNSDKQQAALNLQLANSYLQTGLLETAKTHLDKALRFDASNPRIYNSLGVYYQSRGDQQQAGYYFKTALDQADDNPEIQVNYGGHLCSTGEQKTGIALIQQALASPDNDQPWLGDTQLGICLQLQNNLAAAEQHFRQALAGKCDYTPALLAMQKLSYQNRQYQSARGFWERYLSLGKPTAESLWLALQTERALGNVHTTEQYRQQLLADFPNSQQAQQTKTAISN